MHYILRDNLLSVRVPLEWLNVEHCDEALQYLSVPFSKAFESISTQSAEYCPLRSGRHARTLEREEDIHRTYLNGTSK